MEEMSIELITMLMMMNSVVSERSGGYHCLRRDLNEHSARNKEQDNGGDEDEDEDDKDYNGDEEVNNPIPLLKYFN